VKNILSDPKFQALHQSEPFTPKKCHVCEKNGDFGAETDPFMNIQFLITITFHEDKLAAT
jgi:hypothetical protein